MNETTSKVYEYRAQNTVAIGVKKAQDYDNYTNLLITSTALGDLGSSSFGAAGPVTIFEVYMKKKGSCFIKIKHLTFN